MSHLPCEVKLKILKMKKNLNRVCFSQTSKFTKVLLLTVQMTLLLFTAQELCSQSCTKICQPTGQGDSCIVLTKCEDFDVTIYFDLNGKVESYYRPEHQSSNSKQTRNFFIKCWKLLEGSILAQLVIVVLVLIFLPSNNWKQRLKIAVSLIMAVLPFIKIKQLKK